MKKFNFFIFMTVFIFGVLFTFVIMPTDTDTKSCSATINVYAPDSYFLLLRAPKKIGTKKISFEKFKTLIEKKSTPTELYINEDH